VKPVFALAFDHRNSFRTSFMGLAAPPTSEQTAQMVAAKRVVVDALLRAAPSVEDGRPTLLLPADFTCKQICGPALTIASSALQQTGLVAGRDYSLVVVGIDPRDTIDDARRFTQGQIGGTGTSVLTGSQGVHPVWSQ